MATKTTVIHTDDLDGTEAADVHAVEFSIDGVDYTIDLTDENHNELREDLQRYIDAGQVVKRGKGPKSKGKGPKGKSGGSDREETQAIREWAQAQGFEVASRGRIPSNVREAYHAA